MNIKKVIAAGIMAMVALATFAVPEVTNVTAKQRYPWNGLVDITCKVTGINGATNGLEFAVAAVNQNSGNIRYTPHFWVVQGGTNSSDHMVHVNGNYKLLWNAHTDLGQGLYSNIVVRVTMGKACSKVQLWESGPYWATMNIGATKSTEYGYYFWWGDTIGYKWQNSKWVAIDGSSLNFSFNNGNTSTFKTIASLKSEGWITTDEVLALEHDAAHVHWGGSWRMPTKKEMDDINSKCDWTWTTMNGVNGYVVKGKGVYASASIFLPAAGYGRESLLTSVGSYGEYWSSVPYSDGNVYAWYLNLNSSSHYTGSYYGYRNYGQSIRPVQGFAE